MSENEIEIADGPINVDVRDLVRRLVSLEKRLDNLSEIAASRLNEMKADLTKKSRSWEDRFSGVEYAIRGVNAKFESWQEWINKIEMILRDGDVKAKAWEKGMEERIQKIQNGVPDSGGWKRILQLETVLEDVASGRAVDDLNKRFAVIETALLDDAKAWAEQRAKARLEQAQAAYKAASDVLEAAQAAAGTVGVEWWTVSASADDESPPLEVIEGSVIDKSVLDLGFDVRIRKCMIKRGIRTIGELIAHTGDELMECKNFGVTSLNDVREKLATLGLRLKGE